MAIDMDAGTEDVRPGREESLPHSVINSSTTLDGSLRSETDLRIEGHVTGTIECDGVLFVARGAVIDATVEAGGIIVDGSLSGTVVCHGRLEIRSSGVVSAEVDTQRLVIHDGAVYEGRLRMDTSAGDESAPAPVDDVPQTPTNFSYLRSFSSSGAEDDPDEDDSAASDDE